MKCLETRQRNGMKWRRYVTEGGARVTTYEVPESVLSYLNKDRLETMLRGQQKDIARQETELKVRKLLEQGWKQVAIAAECGVSEKTVYLISKRMKDGNQGT